MRTAASPLLPIFRSAALVRILTTLFVRMADQPWSVTKIAEASGVTKSQASRDLRRLEGAGVLRSRAVGSARLFRIDPDSAFHAELSSLVLKAFGPAIVLEELLRKVPDVEEAYIFGSWADRYLGESGPAARDIDLLLVGDPDIEAVYAACRDAEAQLNREVNPTIIPVEDWKRRGSGFVQTVRERALVQLFGAP